MRRLTIYATVLVLAVLPIAGCGGGDGAADGTSDDVIPIDEPVGEAEAASELSIGEKGTAGDWDIVVESVERAPEAGGAAAAEEGELLVIKLKLTNNGAEGQGTGPAYFKLAGLDGFVYEAAPTNDQTFIFNTPQPIGAGETRSVSIAYNVPVGTEGFTFTFEPFVEGGTTPVVYGLQ